MDKVDPVPIPCPVRCCAEQEVIQMSDDDEATKNDSNGDRISSDYINIITA